jgi:hypothetical protein
MTSSSLRASAAALGAVKSLVTGLVATAIGLAATAVVSAQPAQVVDVCGQDDAGGGLNLSTALSRGGSIVIRCPAGQDTIELTQARTLPAFVEVEGGAG